MSLHGEGTWVAEYDHKGSRRTYNSIRAEYREEKYLGVWPQLAIESQYMNGVHPVCPTLSQLLP